MICGDVVYCLVSRPKISDILLVWLLFKLDCASNVGRISEVQDHPRVSFVDIADNDRHVLTNAGKA